MTPKMLEALYQLSLCHDPDPNVIFQRIVETVGEYYGRTMAMINLAEESCVRYRAVVNPHRLLRGMTALEFSSTFCQFALRSSGPILIQDARQDPAYAGHPAIKVGLTRYLGVPICTPNGAPIGTLCFLDRKTRELLGEEDIQFLSLLAMRVSAELERERIILARLEEHRTAAERLRDLNARLEATADEKRRFVRMVIHDLRHPLTAMRTLLYLLEAENDPTERAVHLATLENRLHALNQLLEGLTQYDCIEAGHANLHIERVELAAVLSRWVSDFAPAFSSEPVQFCYDLAPDLGTTDTDCDKLNHILLNLLSNALKFTPHGCVEVRARSLDADHWLLEVKDTGIGIPVEAQARIFEEFYQAHPAGKAMSHGSGLGLAIVKRLCDALQGRITVHSAPDAGTCFQLVFPRFLS